jgi:hypothetical protein
MARAMHLTTSILERWSTSFLFWPEGLPGEGMNNRYGEATALNFRN